MSEDKSIYYIYIHRKLSDNSIFYVGKGCNGRCRSDLSRNVFWWKVVIEEGGFTPCIVKSQLTEEEALNQEQLLINDIGYENLTNITPGEFGKNGIEIKETLSENGQKIPYEATKEGFLSKQKSVWKKRSSAAEKTLPNINEYTFLENYFEIETASIVESSKVKEVTAKTFKENKKSLEKLGICSPVPSSKVALYFRLDKPKNKRINGKVVKVIEGLKIKDV